MEEGWPMVQTTGVTGAKLRNSCIIREGGVDVEHVCFCHRGSGSSLQRGAIKLPQLLLIGSTDSGQQTAPNTSVLANDLSADPTQSDWSWVFFGGF